MHRITSRQNPIVRGFRALAETADPSGSRLLLDGVHLVGDAYRAGLELERVAIPEAGLEGDTEEARIAQELDRTGVDVVVASDQVFAAISPVRAPSGIVAV